MTRDKKTGKVTVTEAEAKLLEKAKQRQLQKEKQAELRDAKKKVGNGNHPKVCEAFHKAAKPGQFITFRNRDVPGRSFMGLILTKGKKDLKDGTRFEIDVLLPEPAAGKSAEFQESGADRIHVVYADEVIGIGGPLKFPKEFRNTVKLPKVPKVKAPVEEKPATKKKAPAKPVKKTTKKKKAGRKAPKSTPKKKNGAKNSKK